MSYQPREVVGLRAPLFDLLVDSAPEQQMEISPPRIYGREAVRTSIARDLQRLLNTRCASSAMSNGSTATVLDYGLPDFSHLNAASAADRTLLAETLRAAIVCFEPRVQDVSVMLEVDPRSPSLLAGMIACKVKFGSFQEPVTFPLLLNCGDGDVQISEIPADAEQSLQFSTVPHLAVQRGRNG